MNILTGDIWNLAEGDVNSLLAITTNGILDKHKDAVMGAGIAKQAKLIFPYLPRELGKYIAQGGNQVYNLGHWKIRRDIWNLCSFPTKHHWKDRSDLELIKTSCLQIIELVNRCGFKKIYIPRPGCGAGGLLWKEEVEPILSSLDDRFYIVGFNAKEFE